MTDSPDDIRADIEHTRAELGMDVDALADKVTPSKIVGRQTDRVKGAVRSLRERVMGTAEDAGSAVADTASGLAHGASGMAHDASAVAHDMKAKAEGNPLAVGLIAFGVGLLTASLLPPTEKEKQMATAVKEQAQPLVDEVASVAKDAAAHLQEPAQEAVAAVKDRAQEAVENVTQEAADAADEVKDRARQAQGTVAGD